MSDSIDTLLRRVLLIVALLYCAFVLIRQVVTVMRKRNYMMFMYCLNNGDLEGASGLFRRLVVRSPKSIVLWPIFRMAFLDLRVVAATMPLPYERLREFFDGLAREALDKAPTSPYSFLLAAGLSSQRLPGGEECRDYLSQALALANRRLDVYMWAGEIQMIAGQYRDSARYFNTVQRVAKLNRSEHLVRQANIALAQLHSAMEASHKLDKSLAVQYWSKSADLEKDDVDRVTHLLMKANEYARCGNDVAALEALYDAYSGCPEESRTPALVVLLRPFVTTLLRQNNVDLAETVVVRAKQLGVQGCSIEEARIAWHRGDKKNAQELSIQAIDEDDGTEIFALRLALLQGEMGHEAKKLALLEQAYQKSGNKTLSVGSNESKISDFTVNTIVFFPFEPNLMGLRGVNSELATAYQERGMYDEAVSVWKRVLRYDEHNPVKAVQLAKALSCNGQREEAIKYAHQAEARLVKLLEEAPDCSLLHLALGDVYNLDGDSTLAALHYRMVSCEPHIREARRAWDTLDVDPVALLKSIAKHVDSTEDSESRSRLASFLAVYGPGQTNQAQEAEGVDAAGRERADNPEVQEAKSADVAGSNNIENKEA